MTYRKSDEGISFTRSPAKHGKYYVITIPIDYIKSGEIDPDMIYKIILKPIKKISKET